MSDDWAEAMREAAERNAAVAVAEPDEELSAAVPWQRIETDGGRVDVQVIASDRTGRKLLIVELDAGDKETERRVLSALRIL